jgi:hypothetical protein
MENQNSTGNEGNLSSEKIIKKSRISKKIFLWAGILLMIGLLICVVIVFSTIKIGYNTGSIKITDARITTGIDPQGNPLPAVEEIKNSEPIVYCYVRLSAPKPILVGARWYLNNKLVYERQEMVDEWGAFLIQPKPGTTFQEGDYRVEVYLVKEALKTLHFKVIK